MAEKAVSKTIRGWVNTEARPEYIIAEVLRDCGANGAEPFGWLGEMVWPTKAAFIEDDEGTPKRIRLSATLTVTVEEI